MKKNQNGFGSVETIIVVFVLALVGGLGWVAYGQINKKNTTTDTAQKQTTPSKDTTNTDLYKDWHQCIDKGNGIAFKYPSTWTTSPTGNNSCNTVHPESGESAFKIVSPLSTDSKYRYRIQYFSDVEPGAQLDYSNVGKQKILSVLALNKKFSNKPFYLVSYSTDDTTVSQFFVTDQQYTVGQVVDYVQGVSSYVNDKGKTFQFTASMEEDENQQYIGPYTLSDYTNQPDYSIMLKIFQSISNP